MSAQGNHSSPPAKVLIAGGGVAGLEAALALRDLAGDRVAVEICSPREDFVYRPFAVGEPYGHSRPMRYGLAPLAAACGAELRLESVGAVDAEQRRAVTHDGERLDYDYLVLAPGSRMLWSVPGTVPFWGVPEEGAVYEVTRGIRDGSLRTVVFTLPGVNNWALPVYELALLAGRERRAAGNDGQRLLVVTPEEAPLGLFGRRAGEEVGAFLRAEGIEVLTGAHPIAFEGGQLRVAPGDEIAADAVVSLPRLEGRQIDGVPHDEDGFVPVDEHGWVRGLERVLAVGDVTSFPVKQGGISSQQADAAAEAIAVAVGAQAEARPFEPVLRGVLWTGGKPRYVYGKLGGGYGETSVLSEEAPWSTARDDKIIARYLTPFLEEFRGPNVNSITPI
jgi:sulfide:quinone oxidoreductase